MRQERLDRAALRERLASETFDVLVIGGGITGVGVALDAAARGLKVALVDRRDFGSGTSSWSTKLVHGGIRYVPQRDFALVREALHERGRLLRLAPHLVRPLAFLLPLYDFNRYPLGLPWLPKPYPLRRLAMRIGLTLYDVLAGSLNIARHRGVSAEELARTAPRVRRDGLIACYEYWDAQTDDTRLVLTVALTAAAHGAVLLNYCGVTGFERVNGRLAGASVRDELDGTELVVRARVFVNATGIYGEELERMAGVGPAVQIAPSKGVHLVLPREAVPLAGKAVVLPETRDRRLLFLVPYGSRVVFGTTDTGSGPLEEPLPDDADIDYLLEEANVYLTEPLSRADVVSAYAGYRPLIRRGDAASTARLSRSHELIDHPEGMVSILGGKLTTYRQMAEETVDCVLRHLGRSARPVSRELPLLGATGFAETPQRVARLAEELGVVESLPTLLQAYGSTVDTVLQEIAEQPELAEPLVPGLPYLTVQVAHACRYELAQTLTDVFERRTWLLFADWEHGLSIAERASHLMARELGWDEQHRQHEVAAYRARVLRLCGAARGIAERLDVARAQQAERVAD